eukprot:4408691-Prymnesium_polylepis.1
MSDYATPRRARSGHFDTQRVVHATQDGPCAHIRPLAPRVCTRAGERGAAGGCTHRTPSRRDPTQRSTHKTRATRNLTTDAEATPTPLHCAACTASHPPAPTGTVTQPRPRHASNTASRRGLRSRPAWSR